VVGIPPPHHRTNQDIVFRPKHNAALGLVENVHAIAGGVPVTQTDERKTQDVDGVYGEIPCDEGELGCEP
jgi:hypothetical protein